MPSDELTRDTIAAVATPPGRGGIGIVRLSGPAAARIARQIVGNVPAARHATSARFTSAQAEPIDEGIALYFPAPHSYTGEDTLEISCHGNPFIVQKIIEDLLARG